MENKKVNYYLVSLEEIEKFDKNNKPTIAIHACCGPCACYPVEFLSHYFSKITIIYNNSNIYPKEEYIRRKAELVRYIEGFNKTHDEMCDIVEFEYDNESYNKILDEYGEMMEGLSRCQRCYRERMDEAYAYADKLGYDYFCTIMTISRQKSSQVMNDIGLELSKKYKTKYFFSDFKKKGGQLRANEIKKEYDMYNQQYCGCIYSYNWYLDKINKTKDQ